MARIEGIPEFVGAIYSAILPRIRKAFCTTQTGKVAKVSGSVVHVTLKEDSKATPMARCCETKVGDTVLTIHQGTKYYVIGVVR